jgi:hypothetical protein
VGLVNVQSFVGRFRVVVTFVVTFGSLLLEFPVFSGDEMCFSSVYEARLNELKRKEFTDRLGKTQGHRGMVGQLTLDQHIGVRIPGGQPTDNKLLRKVPLQKAPQSMKSFGLKPLILNIDFMTADLPLNRSAY